MAKAKKVETKKSCTIDQIDTGFLVNMHETETDSFRYVNSKTKAYDKYSVDEALMDIQDFMEF